MKLCSPSNGCETRPVKDDPPTPVASLAASAVTKTPMRRHASEWAVGFYSHEITLILGAQGIVQPEGEGGLDAMGKPRRAPSGV